MKPRLTYGSVAATAGARRARRKAQGGEGRRGAMSLDAEYKAQLRLEEGRKRREANDGKRAKREPAAAAKAEEEKRQRWREEEQSTSGRTVAGGSFESNRRRP